MCETANKPLASIGILFAVESESQQSVLKRIHTLLSELPLLAKLEHSEFSQPSGKFRFIQK